MWLLTLIIGSILGWYAHELINLLKQLVDKSVELKETVEKIPEDEPGVISGGKVYSRGKIQKLKPVDNSDEDDSPIVRSLTPEQFAIQQVADERAADRIQS